MSRSSKPSFIANLAHAVIDGADHVISNEREARKKVFLQAIIGNYVDFMTELYGFVELESEAKKRTTMLPTPFRGTKGFCALSVAGAFLSIKHV